MKRALVVAILGGFCICTAAAQRVQRLGDLSVKVLYSNSRSMKLHVRVELLNGTGILIKQAFTDRKSVV